MSEPKRFTRQQIDTITFHVTSLEQAKRQRVRDVLYHYHDVHGGMFYPESFRLELLKLRHANEISDLELHDVESAFFGS